MWLLNGKTIKSEETGDIPTLLPMLLMLLLFVVVVVVMTADLVVVRSEEAGVVIFHPLLPPPGSQSWKTSHPTKAVTVQTKSPWETRNEK